MLSYNTVCFHSIYIYMLFFPDITFHKSSPAIPDFISATLSASPSGTFSYTISHNFLLLFHLPPAFIISFRKFISSNPMRIPTILFHNKRHPKYMGKPEIEAFLSHLATDLNVASSTQNQAFNAIIFLYQRILDIELPEIDSVRAKKPKKLPVVMTKEECMRCAVRWIEKKPI